MDPKELAKARNSPENQKRLEDLKRIGDADKARISEGAKIFDPIALLARANEIHEVTHPQLGVIRFGELMLTDSEVISQCREKNDRVAMSVYLMLKKAYPEMPTYTSENISGFFKTFPLVEGMALLQFFLGQPCFLGEKSIDGLKQTQAPTS